MKAALMVFVLFTSVISAGGQAQVVQPAPAEPKFSLTIKTAQGTVKVGSDVVVEAEMKNISAEDIFYSVLTGRGPGPVPSGFTWEILNSEGKPVPLTEYGLKINQLEPPQGEVGSGGYVPAAGKTVFGLLGPGKAIVEHRALSKEYDLGKPGKYSIQALRSDGKTDVKSNTITVTITP
jgi:hypothetical protein